MFYALDTRLSQPSLGFQRRHNSALERFLSDAFASQGPTSVARTAAVEDQENSYSLQLDVPGLAREQLDISIEADVVRVTSKDDASRKVKAAWRFPLEIDVAASTAKLENGVLTLSLGKKIPVSNVAQLAIQ